MRNNILLVGNGITYIKNPPNESIYQQIVRMNDFQFVFDYRITYWVVNANNRLNKKRVQRLDVPKDVELLICGDDKEKVAKTKSLFLNQGFTNIKNLYKQTEQLKHQLNVRPSIGIISISYFIEFYERVSVSGFDLLLDDNSKCLHYWGKLDGKRYGQWYPHDHKKEAIYLKNLHKSGKIKIEGAT